jgi:hypothetical protein
VCVAPPGLGYPSITLPTAHAVGSIIPPLRGWILAKGAYARDENAGDEKL